MSGSAWRYVSTKHYVDFDSTHLTLSYRHPYLVPRDTQLQNVTERLHVSQQQLLPPNEVIEGLVLRAGCQQFQRAAAKKALLKDAGAVSRRTRSCS